MSGHEFFERLLPRFALQSGAAKKTAGRQADAERLIATAEYECSLMRSALVAAFAVPLSHRAVEVADMEPETSADATPAAGAAKAA